MRIDQPLPVSPEERTPLLAARREAKMTSSVHAYVRGSTKRFYEWSTAAPPGTFPSGPSIWIGGDCHVGNFGAIAAMGGELGIDLRDLDQTVIGSPVHDVMRLGLSMAMAVRASDLPGECTARVLESIARGYASVLEARAAHLDFIVRAPPAQVTGVLREATSRSRREALAERLGKHDGTIPIGRRFWPLTQPERTAVERLILTARVRKLVTSLSRRSGGASLSRRSGGASLTSRDDDTGIELVDAAYWVKGCSSLGYFRAAALVRVGGAKGTSKSLALLDVKEAIPALAPRAPRSRMPSNHGERVVTGARALAPSLGERMAAASLRDKHVFVRELLPQDLKLELTRLRREEAIAIGGYLGSVLGVAHARQLTPAACAAWLASFRRGKSDNLTVPAWLWSAVVELVALHERAYLDHCRKHLADGPRPRPAAEDLPLTG